MTPNRPTKFKQIEVTRALKGALAAGLVVTGYRICPTGEIKVETNPNGVTGDDTERGGWT